MVRKELTGGVGIYTPEQTERTYAECLRRAAWQLSEGGRVILDATFRAESTRRAALEAARRCGVPALLLLCQADPDVVRTWLANRRGDASDADQTIFEQFSASWQESGPLTRPAIRIVDTSGTPEEALDRALAHLHKERLAEPA